MLSLNLFWKKSVQNNHTWKQFYLIHIQNINGINLSEKNRKHLFTNKKAQKHMYF